MTSTNEKKPIPDPGELPTAIVSEDPTTVEQDSSETSSGKDKSDDAKPEDKEEEKKKKKKEGSIGDYLVCQFQTP